MRYFNTTHDTTWDLKKIKMAEQNKCKFNIILILSNKVTFYIFFYYFIIKFNHKIYIWFNNTNTTKNVSWILIKNKKYVISKEKNKKTRLTSKLTR